jgi:hypothetical protein
MLGVTAPGVNGKEDNRVILRTYAHVMLMQKHRGTK